MKILATKKEMAKMVRTCANSCACSSCVLQEFCCEGSSENAVEDFTEIVEDVDEK